MAVEEEQKEGAPAWMVSFGDMMTLILTFFILLVSMSREQQEGLLARGVGSFMVALRSFGLPGVLDESEEMSIFEGVRHRFNLPPEKDPNRRSDFIDASDMELVRSKAARALRPHFEHNQPGIAVFASDSSQLDENARRYLDLLASTLKPLHGQRLLLEGHALDAGPRHNGDNRWLAYRRARVVADYLIEEHDFPPARLESRAWLVEIDPSGPSTRSVDARLVTPSPTAD